MNKKNESELIDALKQLLTERKANSQDQICVTLEAQGYEVNQSKISRLLRKINAIKVNDSQGQIVYTLPREPAPPTINTPLKNLIVDVVFNESMVIIFTSPGSASMVARLLDYNQENTEILGTIAGDDTIFVAPKSVSKINKLIAEINELLKDY